MTVGEMRIKMRRKVLPESVVVQNIAGFLMDDEAGEPELDAFSFLNRLRELGLGSADFLYLLEGCGAPDELVESVRENPAMNLRQLVMTFERAGLTAEDYGDMLYTARQLWEQTQTLHSQQLERIAEKERTLRFPSEKSHKNAEKIKAPDALPDIFNEEEASEPADIVAEKVEETEEKAVEIIENAAASDEVEKENDGGFTEINFAEKVEETEEKVVEITENAAASDEVERENDGEFTEINFEEKVEETEEKAVEIIENAAASDEVERENDGEAEEKSSGIEEKNDGKPEENVSFFEEKPAEFEDIPETFFEDISDNNVDLREIFAESEAKSDEDNGIFEELSDAADIPEKLGEQQPFEVVIDYSGEPEPKTYKRSALVTAGLGAAALCGLSVFTGFYLENHQPFKPKYAEENIEVYEAVYKGYSAARDDDVKQQIQIQQIARLNPEHVFFGGIVFTDSENSGIRIEDKSECFSIGEYVYNADYGAVTARKINGSTLSDEIVKIEPPEGCEFADFLTEENAVTAVFSGKESGWLRIENAAVTFTVRQDGRLCDFKTEENVIKIGTVYVPEYERSFGKDDTEVYFPRLGKDTKKPVDVRDIALSGTQGYAFAVSAEYRIDTGEVIKSAAGLGDAVYAGADGMCLFYDVDKNQNKCAAVMKLDTELKFKKLEQRPTEFAEGKDIAAMLFDDEGASSKIAIFDVNFEQISEINGNFSSVDYMEFVGDTLTAGTYVGAENKETGFKAAFDCSDAKNPVSAEFKTAVGAVSGKYACTFASDGKMLTIEMYKNVGGRAELTGSYTKYLPAEQLKTLKITAAGAFSDDGGAAAYEYFDGVSVISECVVIGKTNSEYTLYDDKTGYKLIFGRGGKVFAVNSKGVAELS